MVRTEALNATAAEVTEELCRRCGSRLAADQEWCLECGVARTLLRAPPDWRGPAALVLGVIVLAVIGLAVLLVSLAA